MIRALLQKLFQRHLPWYERHFTWLLILGVAVAMAISLTIGLLQSVWFDEAYSIWLAKQPLGELLRLTSLDTHPPLYYMLLKAWAGVWGWSEVALRSFSVLAMGGALTVGVLFVKKTFGVRAALVALVFAALTPFLLRYGFEIRMYALASLIGIAATYALVCAVDEKNSRKQLFLYGIYAILVVLGVYTMYYTALLWITHVVWLLWMAKSRREPMFKQSWRLAYIGSVVLFLPWLPTFVTQLTNGALAPIAQQMTVENLVGVVSFSFLYQSSWQLQGFSSLVILGVIIAVTYASITAFRVVGKKQRPYLVLLGLYAVVPVLLIALISLVKPLYVERYLSHVLIGAVLYVGVVVWLTVQKDRVLQWVLPGGITAVLLFGVMTLANNGNYNFQRLQLPAVKSAASTVACNDRNIILAADPYVAIELAYYLPNCEIYFYSTWTTLTGGYAPLSGSPLQITNPESQLSSAQRIVFIYDGDTPTWQMPNGFTQVSSREFQGMKVKVLEK